MKFHLPTSLALVPEQLADTPDVFQTTEWFGSGAAAQHLTIASERFANLYQERGWTGLLFDQVKQSGWSQRAV